MTRGYFKEQSINDYVEMLSSIFGSTQNYDKSKYEIFSHLTEICGVTGKFLLKKSDLESADRFMPKIFGWVCALVQSVERSGFNLEEAILRKYPGVCPYCMKAPCGCWQNDKPTLQPQKLRSLYIKNSASQKRSIDDFELMFVRIYGHTWTGKSGNEDPIVYTYTRLIEELSEVAEAVRFHHLYPENFENEVADLISWWFALAHVVRLSRPQANKLTSEIVWQGYPGNCKYCESNPCFCLQAPVRELMSKPSPGSLDEVDALTSLRNQNAYKSDISKAASEELSIAFPAACVRGDIDKFKNINDGYSHEAGDLALQHIATVLRSKARPRDRIYRISGDEFGVLMPDTTEEEAVGVMRRMTRALTSRPVRWVRPTGQAETFFVTLSFGVAECEAPFDIGHRFELADQAAIAGKQEGGGRVVAASSLDKSATLF